MRTMTKRYNKKSSYRENRRNGLCGMCGAQPATKLIVDSHGRVMERRPLSLCYKNLLQMRVYSREMRRARR